MPPKVKKDDELGELSEAQSKFLSAEHKNLFFYQRSLIYDQDSVLSFGGPDADTAAQFLLFCSDPPRFVAGAGYFDGELRPRINLLQTESPFADCFARIVAEARARQAAPVIPPRVHDDSPFRSDIAVEVMAELAAIFVIWQQVKNDLPPKNSREISRLVGLLRAKKAALVCLKADDFKEFRGRSLVSLIIHQQENYSASYTVQPSNKRERDEPQNSKDGHKDKPHKQPLPKKIIKNPSLRCSTCTGAGHDAAKCCNPHPHCMPSWRCFGCNGNGHSMKFCPTEFV